MVYSIALTTVFPTFDKFKGAEGETSADGPEDGPAVINRMLSQVTVGLEGDGRLRIEAQSDGDLRVTHDEQPNLWHFRRTHTFYMVEKAGGGWIIDGWNGKFKASSTLTD